jgi:spore coat polysaccharide biosynthesis protein SpsF (cytidylyltransferase family)
MNPVILICSRRASSRLPEKALRPICGRSPLRHILHRVSGKGIKTVVAVPPEEAEVYMHEVQGYDAELYFGRADSPLHRMAEYLTDYPGHDWVIRITCDDILIHWETVAAMLETLKDPAYEDRSLGYCWTPAIAEGCGVEIIRAENLLAAAAARTEGTEFISYFVKGEGMPFPGVFSHAPLATVRRDYRLTLDYPEDATLLELLLRRLGANVGAAAVCAYLDDHPDLPNINRLPEVSFYTCARNAEEWIVDAVQSVRDAMGPDDEYIIVDDGSTDRTVDRIAMFLPDPRIKLLVNTENIGLASSSNAAIKAARGRYVMRVDADDLLLGEITNLVELADDTLADIVYPAYDTFSGEGLIDIALDPRKHHHIGGALVRKRLLDQIRFKDGLRHWDGLELLERARKHHAVIQYVDEYSTWQYRIRPGSMSRSEHETRAAIKAEITGGGKD